MINTFLFDLDGTLLPMDMSYFEKQYFGKLAQKLAGYFKPDALVKYIWKSTGEMIKNTGGVLTNKEVFFRDFKSSTGGNIDLLYPLFDEFYIKEFKELRPLFPCEPYIVKAVELLKARGYTVVVATNPIFPMEAIKERIRWAGLKAEEFKYITSYENMHYCKPNVEYYSEVLRIIGCQPEECIMVGNDVEEDLTASKIGIKTYLIKNCMINRGGGTPDTDFEGTYNEFYDFVRCNFKDLDESSPYFRENVV